MMYNREVIITLYGNAYLIASKHILGDGAAHVGTLLMGVGGLVLRHEAGCVIIAQSWSDSLG